MSTLVQADTSSNAAWVAVGIAALAFLLGILNLGWTYWVTKTDRRSKLISQRTLLLEEANKVMTGTLYGTRNALIHHYCDKKYAVLDANDKFGNIAAIQQTCQTIPLCNSGDPLHAGLGLVELRRACIAAHTLYPHARAARARNQQIPWMLPDSVQPWAVLGAATKMFDIWNEILEIQDQLDQGKTWPWSASESTTWTDKEQRKAKAFCLHVPSFEGRALALDHGTSSTRWRPSHRLAQVPTGYQSQRSSGRTAEPS